MPVYAVDFEFLANQVLGVTNDDAIGRRVEIDDIPRTQRTAWQSLALSDREQLDTVVFADELSIHVVNFAAMEFVFAQMRTQKCLVIVARNKTNLLAIGFFGDLQA